MTRPRVVVAALVLTALGASGCTAGPAELVIAGNVSDRVETVAAPLLVTPAVSLDAGFTDSTGPTSPVTGRTSTNTSATATLLGIGSTVRIAEVLVAEGDTVRAGQELARVDDAQLRAQLAVSRADAKAAAAQVDLLAAAIDDVDDKAAEVADKQRDVADAIDELTSTRAKLVKTRRELKQNLPKARAGLKQIEAALAALPPGVPPPPELVAQQKKLKAAVKQMEAGLKQLNQALPKLDQGLRKARDGQRQLKDAAAELADARAQLRDLKELAGIAADAGSVPVELARTQLGLTELSSPVAGVVVSIAAAGDQFAPGATVATVRETAPSRVTAWLSPAQLGRVCAGDAATLTGDWLSAGVPATLSKLGTRAEYPPTPVSTEEVHLTRAVEVEFTATEQLPAGLPVEISIDGCNLAATQPEPNR